jgi:hypothetical protein
MKYQEICESPQTDIDNEAKANEIFTALMQYLLKNREDDWNHYGFKATRFSSGDVNLTIRGSDVGLTGEHADLWFLFTDQYFSEKGRAREGFFSKLKGSGHPVISLHIPASLKEITDETLHQASKYVIFSNKAHRILRHEIVHYLDSFRNHTMLTKEKDENNTSKYYNSPEERNAYWHNIAEPYFTFMRGVKSRSITPEKAEEYASKLKIYKGFKKTLYGLLDNANSTELAWIHGLTKRNYQDLIKRLYGIHQEAIKYFPA